MAEDAETARMNLVASLLSLAAMLIDFILLLLAGYVTTVTRANFANIFTGFGAELPRITAAFIAVPDWLFLGAFSATAVVLAVKEIALRRSPVISLCFNIVVAMGILTGGVMTYMALDLPLHSLVEDLMN